MHVAGDKKSDTSTSSLSSSVHATRVMEENLKKTDNTVTSEGKDDGQILINCIKNCAFYQSSVGAKEARFREIGKEKLELSTEKEKLNADQHDLCGKIAVLDKKSPNFDSNEFREVSYLKFELSQKIKEMESVNKKMAQLTIESDRVKRQIFDGVKMYKSFVFKRDELLHKK